MTLKNKHYVYYFFILAIWAVYVYLTFQISDNHSIFQKFKFSTSSTLLLRIIIIIPALITWLAALYATLTMVDKIHEFAGQKISQGYKSFAVGTGLLLISFVASPLLSMYRSALLNDKSVIIMITIFNNYLYVFLPLVSYWFFCKGVRQFLSRENDDFEFRILTRDDKIICFIFSIIISVIFIILLYTNNDRVATYYLSDSLILITLVVPLGMSGWLGLRYTLALAQIRFDSFSSAYTRRDSRYLFNGFLSLIFASIMIQMFMSLGVTRLFLWSVEVVFIAIYFLIILQSLGSVLVAVGMHKLAKKKINS